MFLIPLDFPSAQFFQYWNLVEGYWEESTGNDIVYFHENKDYLFANMTVTFEVLFKLFIFKIVRVLLKYYIINF